MSKFWSIIFCVCFLCVLQKKFDSIRTKRMEEIHFEVSPYRHNASMDATPRPMQCARRKHRMLAASTNALQRKTPFAAGKVWHRRAAKRYVQKLDIGHVHKFGIECVRKFGIWAHSELGIRHDIRRAFWTGGIRTWGHNWATKTNRLVHIICLQS